MSPFGWTINWMRHVDSHGHEPASHDHARMSSADSFLCRVAVLGAGPTAREHVRAFAAVDTATVVAIHSRTRSKAEALAGELGIPLVCDSVADLYERSLADLVVVAVPADSTEAVVTACLNHPWAVLLEKPPGVDLQAAERLSALVSALQRRALVALNRRFLPSTRAIAAQLTEDDGPRFVSIRDQQSLAAAAAIGHPESVVRNWMFANSIHTIDLLRVFGRGEVVSVRPVFPWRGPNTRIVVASIEFASGDQGLYEGVWEGPGPWSVAVTTRSRRWEMRPLESAWVQEAGSRTPKPIELPQPDGLKPGFKLQADMATRAAMGRASESPTFLDALETMRLIAGVFTVGQDTATG